MKSRQRLTNEVIDTIREAIRDAEGQEVLCVGRLNEEGLVSELETVGRGNDVSAPAIYPFMESGDVVIHNHPTGLLRPSSADVRVASQLGNQGVGFYIVDNEVERIYCVSEPISKAPETEISADDLSKLIRPGGALQRVYPDYEAREPQIRMLEVVSAAFNKRRIAVIEAGTGVGKSLAYLLPAADWALNNQERVIVSTATINLQHQLIDKDIPLVEKLIGARLNAKLVKGRGNYLCLRRLRDALEEMALFQDDDGELAAIKKWAETTPTGSKDDLSFYPSGEIWGRVCSEADACMGLKCSYREECFVLRARREAASANLLVANHHLICSDLAARINGAGFDATAVLPPAHRLIFDEAHSLEKSATSFFSERYNKLLLLKQLGRLYSRRQRRAYGLAVSLQKMSRRPEVFKKIPELVQRLQREAETLDTRILNSIDGNSTLWLKPGGNPEEFESILGPVRDMRSALGAILSTIEEGLSCIEEEHEEENAVFEIGFVQERLAVLSAVLGAIEHYPDSEESVCWIEKNFTSKREEYCSFIRTPLRIADLMQEAVFEPHRTVISTSATLTVRKRFDFWLNRVGLNGTFKDRLDTARLESPFEYRKRVLLAIPADAPEPNREGYQEYVSAFIRESVEMSEGGALILFTSFRMLQATYEETREFLEERGISVLKQGCEDRSRLLRRFHTDVSSVLFATDSFWEGVDAPGESLKLVIICRLPFSVPTDPVTQARMEMVEREGGNSFMQYALPQAAMKLRQGFGRLMRRQSDRGVVVILDSRIVRKSYGKVLLGSLPETLRKIDSRKAVIQAMEDFFYASNAV